MRAFMKIAAVVAALWSFNAAADHYSVVHGPYLSFGFGYGPWAPGYGVYRPYHGYGPYWGPSFGVGVTVAPPPPHQQQPRGGGGQSALKMYVYPAAGQSEARTAEDRYQCHVWAADQSGYDPTLGAGSRDDAEGYTRAFTACMEGRGYVVR
jgi:hypothetical protein